MEDEDMMLGRCELQGEVEVVRQGGGLGSAGGGEGRSRDGGHSLACEQQDLPATGPSPVGE